MMRSKLLLCLLGLICALPLQAEDGDKERKLAPITLSFRLMPMKSDYFAMNSVLGIQFHMTEHWQAGLWLVRNRGMELDGQWTYPNHSLNAKYSLGANVMRTFGNKRWKPYMELAGYLLQMQIAEKNVFLPTNRRYFSYNGMGGGGLQYWISRYVSLEGGVASGWHFSKRQDVVREEAVFHAERPSYQKVINTRHSQGLSWLVKLGVNVKLARSRN